MRRPRRTWASRPPVLLLALLLLALLSGHVVAQRDTPDAATPNQPDNTPRPASPPPAPAPTPGSNTNNNNNNRPSTSASSPTRPTPTPSPRTSPENLPGLTTSSSSSSSSSSSPSSAPATRTSTTTDDKAFPTLPSLTGGPVIPTPQIPPKEGAPYLKKSNLPEGTIFIAVGAALGLVALIVIAWRVLVAWSINRSVRRATNNTHQSDATALLHSNKRRTGVYQDAPGGSMSMEKIAKDRHSRVIQPHTPNQSLFFSPTAGASMHNPGNRASSYLPAGYYSASGATPGGGSGLAHFGGSGLSPLGPQAQGYSRTKSGPSPPASPILPPSSRGHDQLHPSSSSLNLSTPPQGRAPSAYLEDLFENHAPNHSPGR
ncbi:hypothetical protein LOZ53_005108 [Ophidiomyces ophidiicola]|nr:hypothetical protein LOZ53_005108 [Ophidiomyces ophidiicola]